MSSDGWEVVGKNKKDRNNGKAAEFTKAEQKKFIENAPKVEDFLPLSQVKTLYDCLDGNKENKKPQKEKESKTKESEEKKKQQKQHQHQQSEKKKHEPSSKPPKSIKDALNAIKPEELSNILATCQVRFPEAPLIWLKDLAAYLNAKIPIDKEDATFSDKPKDYPINIVPKSVSSTLEKAIEMAGQQTIQLFYENTLTGMATDMAKGTPVIGHKIFLQLLAHLNPEMTIANIPKLISVRNSYQNRRAIGLSLLWAFSQAGVKNLAVGLKMWHEVMAPIIETKGYSNYVAQILNDLVFGHENASNLSTELYLNILEDTCSGKLNIPSTVDREINVSMEKLRAILFKNKNINYSKLFETLMNKVSQKASVAYQTELIKALVACLAVDSHCFSAWRSLYAKHLYQTNLLLTYISTRWDILHVTLKLKCLKETLIVFQTTNERWKKGKEENLVQANNKLCKALLDKMTATTRRKFPWRKGSIVLLLLIGAVLAYDYKEHNMSEARKALSIAKSYLNVAREAVEVNSPEYYKATVDFCAPYIKLSGDVCLVMKNLSIRLFDNMVAYANKKGPVLAATVDYYAPGMLEGIRVQSVHVIQQIQSYTITAGEQMKIYLGIASEKTVQHSMEMIRWLENNVFVGKLSPENLQNCASQTIDMMQAVARQTYDWVHEKVQTLSKVP